jgi:hypothetical protein
MGGSSSARGAVADLRRAAEALEAARARLDRPGRDPRGSRPRSTSSTRCSSSRRSPAARSRRCRCSATSRRSATAAVRRDHRPGQPAGSSWPRARPPPLLREPADIGGRYSVLSLFGLVPAALIGVPIHALLERAARSPSRPAPTSTRAPRTRASGSALAIGELARQGRDKLTFVVGEPISSFGLWVEQLVAESTGKQGRGILPVADEPLRRPSAYGSDRVFVHLRDEEQPDEELDERSPRSARRAPDADADRRTARGPRAALLHRRVRDRGRRLGARDQPVRPAERRRGQGRDQARARRRHAAGAAGRRRDALSRRC